MATNITTTGSTPVVLQQRQHTALSSASCLHSVPSASCLHSVPRGSVFLASTALASGPSFRLVEGRYVAMAEHQHRGIAMIGDPSMTAPSSATHTSSTTLTSIDQATDFGGHRGSDATDGKFSIRSGFRTFSPPV